ncbi:LPO_1073/Vpar_1526 family protein [Stenotrophomonas indicatrix]|uniref:LPO_1073/Vpar_1526 family protein n=1 Tax=Stenotrophomonas indicatrix TaxID=2045451 RepID=UPI00320808F8
MTQCEQSQAVKNGGTALQAGGDIHLQQGLSYQDVRQVAQDLFDANFFRLSVVAREEAASRAEYITEKFLRKLSEENPNGFSKANDPGFQSALYTVQREHAKAGDEDLGDLLVDLLVDRSKQDQRDLIQLVLDESLATAPKLTNGQLSVLAITFALKYTVDNRVVSEESLGDYLDRYIIPFGDSLAVSESSFAHLDFAGCGSTSVLVDISIEGILINTYPALFSKGVTSEEILSAGFSTVDGRIFSECLNDISRFQVSVIRDSEVELVLSKRGVDAGDVDLAKAIYSRNMMSEEEVARKIMKLRPAMGDISRKWSDSGMKSLSLTSVGKAIGHANVKRLVGEFGALSIWIS